MVKISKRFQKIYKNIDKNNLYKLHDAVSLVQERSTAKFDETIEICVNLLVDYRKSEQMIHGVVNLPNGTGKNIRLAVFARDDKAQEAVDAGADVVGSEDLFERISKGIINFNRCISTPDMMPLVGRLGKILGPRGLMPNPRIGTVTLDIKNTILNFKTGSVEFRIDKSGIVHAGIGKASFSKEHIIENVKSFLNALQKAKPVSVKGQYLKCISLSSTMGIGIKIDISSVLT